LVFEIGDQLSRALLGGGLQYLLTLANESLQVFTLGARYGGVCPLVSMPPAAYSF
jgi:hypothetical protein